MKAAIAALIICLAMMFASTGAAQPSLKVQTSILIKATWDCQEKIPRPHSLAYSPWKPHNRSFREAQIALWTSNLNKCQAVLTEKKRQWNWQALDPTWMKLAICETGKNGVPDWFAEGSSKDGTFYSAFNIGRGEYDKDARYMGVRPWYVEGKGVPSPYEQMQAAKGHLARWHGGWTGLCDGIVA